MKRPFVTPLALIVLLATAQAASAQLPGSGSMFDRLDRNGDGVITSDELPSGRITSFLQSRGLDPERGIRREDLDGAMRSGPLGAGGRGRGNGAAGRSAPSGNEESNRGGPRGFGRFGGGFPNRFGQPGGADDAQARERAERLAQRMIERYDQNGDGVLASDEIPDRLGDDLRRLDSNGDGILSADELANRYAPPTNNTPGGTASSKQPFRFRTGPSYPAGLPSWFQQSDANRDGQVAMYEWDRRQLAEFQSYDVNGDGFITAEEALRSNRRSSGSTTAFGRGGAATFAGRGGFGTRGSFGGRGGFSFGGRGGFGGRPDFGNASESGGRERFRGRFGRGDR